MPALTQDEKNKLGQLILPFERNTKGKTIDKDIKDGEKHKDEFLPYIHDGIENKKPSFNYVELTKTEVDALIENMGKFESKCFLWVLDDTSIKIIRENTPNVLRTHKPCVCHTNITGCNKAYVGGEMFFGNDGKIYINYFSDRYGNPTSEQWEVVKKYFIKVGYSPLVDIIDLLYNENS